MIEEQPEQKIRIIDAYHFDRADRLGHIMSRKILSQDVVDSLALRKNESAEMTVEEDGNQVTVDMNRRFVFVLHRLARVLRAELVEAGYEDAADAVEAAVIQRQVDAGMKEWKL